MNLETLCQQNRSADINKQTFPTKRQKIWKICNFFRFFKVKPHNVNFCVCSFKWGKLRTNFLTKTKSQTCLIFHKQSPEHPVVSPVSGQVFEKRLIEKYIQENGVDPSNQQPLTVEDLIELKVSQVIFGYKSQNKLTESDGFQICHLCDNFVSSEWLSLNRVNFICVQFCQRMPLVKSFNYYQIQLVDVGGITNSPDIKRFLKV